MKNQLTEHFSLDELIRSNTATTRGICNMPYQAAKSGSTSPAVATKTKTASKSSNDKDSSHHSKQDLFHD